LSPAYALRPEIYQLRDAIDLLGGIAAISTEGDIVAVSNSFLDVFGYEEYEVVGKPVWMLNYATTVTEVTKRMREALTTGRSMTTEIPCRTKCGDVVMVRLTLAPSFDEEGSVHGFIGLYQRVMPLHCDQLSDLFYRYRAGFNKLAAMAIVSTDGSVIEVNDAFCELFGYTASEINGQPISVLKSPETPPSLHFDLWRTIKQGKVWNGELRNRRKDGSGIYVRSTVSPAPDHYIHSTGDCQDAYLVIYHNNEMEVEARNNRVKLAVESTRQEMMAGALHNIGNVLQSVVASTDQSKYLIDDLADALPQARNHYALLGETAKDFSLSAEARQEAEKERELFLEQVWELITKSMGDAAYAVSGAKNAVNSSLAVLRTFRQQMRNGKRLLTEVRLSELVQQWIEVFAPQVQRHGIVITVSDLPVEDLVTWPLDTVQQIVFNLLKNAKEAISEQIKQGSLLSGKIELAFLESPCGNRIKVSITDTGGGFKIPKDDIFKYKVTTKGVLGTGIGLHNAKIMAESIGASLKVENIVVDTQPGAQLTLDIPRAVHDYVE